MIWLSVQMVAELLLAAVFGGLAGWMAHRLFGLRIEGALAPKPPPGTGTDLETRLKDLEADLADERAEHAELRRKSGIPRAGEDSAMVEGSLAWRNRHLESRVRFLEGKLADLESDVPAGPVEDQNDEATRLRWRNTYLEGRVKYLEEELVRTGGLTPATIVPMPHAEPISVAPRPRAPEGDKPILFDEPRDGQPDDLKMISGIGPKLEQKLNSIGIWHYDQIASWTQKEVDWVNAAISFRGRVEREKWVSQATALLEGAPATAPDSTLA
jgi:predicted flap endonuclease-1-like 5' DNA nuclease